MHQILSHHLSAVSALPESIDCTMALQGEGDWSNLAIASGGATGTIKLTVLSDQTLIKSVQDVGAMPFAEFATLYSVRTFQ